MNKVDEFFIMPLEEYFEAIPKDGPRETIRGDLAEYTADDLHTAAEWLKRARQAQSSFPSAKECLKAIQAVVGGRREPVVIRGHEINASNYAANALAYVTERGMKQCPIIRKGEQQWDEWLAYYGWLGVSWIVRLTNDRDTWTVPTEFPNIFDSRFTPS